MDTERPGSQFHIGSGSTGRRLRQVIVLVATKSSGVEIRTGAWKAAAGSLIFVDANGSRW